MKRILCFTALAVGLALSSPALPFTYETDAELQLDADLDGNGYGDLVIVDKDSGAFRVGYQYVGGNYIWVAGRSSGFKNATGAGSGRLYSLAYDTLVVVGPDANLVSFLEATNASSLSCPQSGFFLSAVGPNACAVLDIGGLNNNSYADVFVASCYNGTNAYRESLIRNTGAGSRTNLAEKSVSYYQGNANAVILHTNRSARLALVEQGTNGSDYFRLSDFIAGTNHFNMALTFAKLPAPVRYIYGQFVATNPCTQVLLYQPGNYFFSQYQAIELSTNNFTLTNLVYRSLVSRFNWLQTLSGGLGNRLLVCYTNDASVGIYSFDGQSDPVLLSSYACAEGYHFTGAGPDGLGGWTFYSAPVTESISTRFARWRWTGSAYTNTSSGDLPRISSYSGAGNVLQFRNEPFVTNQPVLLRVNNAGDWAGLPVYSGSPSNLTVRAEQFISATQGLGAPNSVSLGRAHASARFAIANQYSNAISLYSLTPPRGDVLAEVAITPPGGSYSAAVEFRFTCSDAAAKIYYRIGTTEWANWTNGQTVPLITNATVQYYAQSATNLDKTAVHAAVFTFTQNPSEMDTKGDGIPDYVKLACGLSLTGTADADGDGFSDFEELVNGTDPLAATNSPALTNHIDDQAVFNIVSTPAAWDGFRGRTTNVVTNTTLKVYDLQGSLLRSGGVATNTWPAARLTNITIINEDRLVVLATDPHYTIITTNNDKRIGREMLAMVVVPELKATNINYTYAGGSMVAAANQWVLAASNAMRHVTRGTVTNAMSPDQTLIALLCEKKIAQCLGGRGQVWWTNMTLFPNRPVDLTRTNPAQELLLSIESETNSSPGYRLKSIYQSISNNIYTATVSSKVTNLQAVIRDIYTVSGRYNNSNPATYLSPVDEIRYFLWNGIVDTNYSTKMSTTNLFSNAVVAVNAVLTNVPSRIFTNLIMTIRADTLTNDCRLVNAANGGVYSLIDQSGIPFGLPDGFNLLVGTKVLVGGYIEPLDSICGYPQFEVTAMILDTLPAASDNDSGNLLVDTWERQFFGSVGGHSAFADDDGDGYSNLQEMLEGSDPSDPLGVPAVGIKTFGKPDVELLPNGTGLRLQWNWPWIYKDHFQFGFRQMDNLTGSYSEAVVSTYLAGETDKLYADIAGGGGSQKFYLLTINLK